MVHSHCCNPFNLEKHTNIRKAARSVSVQAADKAKQYLNREITNETICDKCNMKLMRLTEAVVLQNLPNIAARLESSSADSSPGPSERISPETDTAQAERQTHFSELCVELGGSPVKKYRLTEPAYQNKQLEKVIKLTCENVLHIPVPEINHGNHIDDELLRNIKESFNREKNFQNKIYLLTLLPQSWTTVRTMNEFQISQYMVNKAKNLVEENGCGSFPGPRKIRLGISAATLNLVEKFYRGMDISRQLSGIKDCISVRDANGQRTQKQKLLILCNLSEAYQKFLEKFPTYTIGFSTFAQQRPKECILAGKAGTHNVCVCIIHQNNHLLCPVVSKILNDDPVIENEKELLQKVSCQNLTWDCCEGNCNECNLLLRNFLNRLETAAESEVIEEVTYSYWVSTNNTFTLEKITSPIDDIVEMLSDSSKFGLAALRKHHYITTLQNKYLTHVKDNLEIGEYVVILDFSENYKFVTQNEIQAAHYYANQATLFPIVAYYKSSTEKINVLSYVVISEEDTHDTVAVYGFQTKFINFLQTHKAEYPDPKKIYYFSDGAASQFKNKKNFCNINLHERDFKINCEWNFFSTSHGKGPSDGVGGTVKREARIASLRSTDESLFNTPEEFFKWCKYKSNFKSIYFDYVTKQEYANTEKKLIERFAKLKTVKDTRQIHQVMPNKDKKFITTKMFSKSDVMHVRSLY